MKFTSRYGEGEILGQSHHRNGVGGAPFLVTLLKHTEGGDTTTFVCTSFFAYSTPDDLSSWSFKTPRDYRKGMLVLQTSALEVSETAKGNIEFAMGNSWRGSDMFGDAIAKYYEKGHDYDVWED